MNHPISPEDWIDYVDGTLSASARRGLEAHLHQCSECRKTASQLHDLEAFFGRIAAEDALPLVSAAEMRRAKSDFAARLQVSDLISSRLARAHTLLAPICGTGITDQVLRTAVRRTLAPSPEHMSVHDWPKFVSHLTSIMASMCGKPTAVAVAESLAL